MSDVPTDVQGLAVTLREQAVAGTNATRDRDGLKRIEFPAWDELTVDVKDGWRHAARYVIAHYTFRDFDPEALVKAATTEVQRIAMLLERSDCERVARAVLETAGLINAGEERAT